MQDKHKIKATNIHVNVVKAEDVAKVVQQLVIASNKLRMKDQIHIYVNGVETEKAVADVPEEDGAELL